MAPRPTLLALLVPFVLGRGRAFQPSRPPPPPSRPPSRRLSEPTSGASGAPGDDWRAFRARLVSSGLKMTGDDALVPAPATPEAAPPLKKPVAPRNTALLRSQNPALAEEYMQGVWAHALPGPEAGCLLCRRPLAAELLAAPGPTRTAILKAAKDDMLKSINVEGGMLEPGESEERFARWCANGPYMLRLAEKVTERELRAVVKAAEASQPPRGKTSPSGKKPPAALSAAQKDFVRRYQAHAEQWQEVVLVLSYSPSEGATGVVINRPLSKGLTPQLGALLFGGKPALERAVAARRSFASSSSSSSPEGPEADFVRAFADGVVYQGGPDLVEAVGLLVHGNRAVSDASGGDCREVATGSRLYVGGMQAAAAALLVGGGQALEYRLFVGRKVWAPGALEREVRLGKWQCAASARPVALKQCLALPKPLWHEVMELVGGDAEMLSRFEFLERTDLEEEEEVGGDAVEVEEEEVEEEKEVGSGSEGIDDEEGSSEEGVNKKGETPNS